MPVPFPHVSVTTAVPFLADSPHGMFAWRQFAKENLLRFPDPCDGDLTTEQRPDALERFVEIQQPHTALALFWIVMSLEDLLRETGTRLNQIPVVVNTFKGVNRLAPKPVRNPRPGRRPDDDQPYLSFSEMNKRYQKSFKIDAVYPTLVDQLADLALIRHTIAHHGAIVRAIDVPRFRHYQFQGGEIINPPVSFVRDIGTLVYSVGSDYLATLRQRIFDVIVRPLMPIDPNAPPQMVVDLIEAFSYFGKRPPRAPVPGGAPPRTEAQIQQQQQLAEQQARQALLLQCLAQLPSTAT